MKGIKYLIDNLKKEEDNFNSFTLTNKCNHKLC